MPPATSWQAMDMIRDRSKTTWAIGTFSTPFGTLSFRQRASRISGAIRSCLGKTNAADAGTLIEAEPVSVELWSQVIDPTRDYFSEFMLPPHLPTNMSELGRVLIDTLRYVHPESGHQDKLAVSYDPA